MPWSFPTPDEIASEGAAVYEGALDGNPDARSPNSVLGATCRVAGTSTYGVYLGQAAQANELWPDTAVDELERLAGIWGLTRTPATPASCNATLAASAPTDVLLATQATGPNNLVYQTTAAVTVGTGPTVLHWVCRTAGAAGTLAASDTLTLVSPIGGLTAQAATVLGDATLTPGEDQESLDSLRARLLFKIRSSAAAGNSADWTRWVREALPLAIYVSVFPRWAGIGNTGIAVAMSGPRAPTTDELAAITAYLSDLGRKPTTAVPIVFAAPLAPVNLTLHLVPDTLATRAAAIAALSVFFLQDAAIANPAIANSGTIAMSRLDAALSAGDGEWEHVRSAPTADVTVATGSLPVLGAVSFV